uniref:Uncharacterized protein n=1 Tax=Labrus bergylta TaxID=56723 RepID=A0A3Q3E2G3_9LABR
MMCSYFMGRCKCSFWFAVAHDILGVFIMMVGVFGGLVVHDLFIYAGAIIIFLSLIWWVFWYSGNIDLIHFVLRAASLVLHTHHQKYLHQLKVIFLV